MICIPYKFHKFIVDLKFQNIAGFARVTSIVTLLGLLVESISEMVISKQV